MQPAQERHSPGCSGPAEFPGEEYGVEIVKIFPALSLAAQASQGRAVSLPVAHLHARVGVDGPVRIWRLVQSGRRVCGLGSNLIART